MPIFANVLKIFAQVLKSSRGRIEPATVEIEKLASKTALKWTFDRSPSQKVTDSFEILVGLDSGDQKLVQDDADGREASLDRLR